MKWAAIDFETANPSPMSACAVGLTVFDEGEMVFSDSWLIRPHPYYDEFYPSFIDIHGITPDQVADASFFPAVYDQLKPWLDGGVMCAHNAGFDMKVMASCCSLYRLELPDAPYFCTVQLSRKVYPYLKHHRLNDVCDYMGIRLNHHDAGSDARGCALIVANTMNLMQIYQPAELAEACQIPVKKSSISLSVWADFFHVRSDAMEQEERKKAMDYPKKALGFMLRQNRIEQNLSLRFLAERTGISAMYLSDVENGVQLPAEYTLRKLISELALPYDPAMIFQPDFSLEPLYQALLDYRMDRRDQIMEDLENKRESLSASCHYAQLLLARWIVKISRGENRAEDTLALRDTLVSASAALNSRDLQWYQLYQGIHQKALDEVETAQTWLKSAEALGQEEGVQALIHYHQADSLFRLHKPQSALLMNQRALDQFSRGGYFVRAIHTRIHQADLYLNDEPNTAKALALRVCQEAERFRCPEVQLMAQERLAIAEVLLDDPKAALEHALACVPVIHRPALLIAGALAGWQCGDEKACLVFLKKGRDECRRKKQSDATFRFLAALLRQDRDQLIELGCDRDELAGPLQKKLRQLRYQTLRKLGETERACALIDAGGL